MLNLAEGRFYWVHIKGHRMDIVYVTEQIEKGQKYLSIMRSDLFEMFKFPDQFKQEFNPIAIDPKTTIGSLAIETFAVEFCKSAGVRKNDDFL